MKNINETYKTVRVKTETYKKLKQLALDLDMPLTRLINLLYNEYTKIAK